jgi:DNA repair exonuclease SbcCD ATPase subunit
MITGDNGAGKSTILDAIQFVLCGGKTKFNQAAHEKAKRDLLGYVRCKTGRDENEYERTGDVTSHISIEFYEEKKKKYFIIGTVIDSASNLSNPKMVFYRIENKRLADDIYFKGNIPRNISDLINQTGYVAILAIGMTIILIIKHIDLSVGYVAGFLGAVAAILM